MAELQAVRQADGNASPGEEAYLKNVKAMMENVPWQIASKMEQPEPFKKYEKSAMDLRAHEQLALDLGGEGPAPKDMNLRLLPAGSKVPKPKSQ